MASGPQRVGRELLERADELAIIDAAIARVATGVGGAVLITGPAGIGKTALLDAAVGRGVAAGLEVLSARGGEIEGEFAYGVMRQLFEGPLAAASEGDRERLLNGAAALAVPAVLAPPSGASQPAADPYALYHGIYWLIANLAAEGPLAILIDDAQWADAPSLAALNHFVRRVDGLPVVIVVSIRTGDETQHPELLDLLTGDPDTEICSPGPLSDESVGRILAAELDQQPDQAFAAASRVATGGNPFLVRELALALAADEFQPTAASIAGLEQIGPVTVARSILARVGRLSPDAVRLAQAIAVLAGDATLGRAVALSELDERSGPIALDALVAAHVVQATPRLQFSHAIVRRAIYEELAPGARSLAHRRAAELLVVEGAEPEPVAGHLLLTQPLGSVETVTRLRAAAAQALSVAAPESAVTYLERALAEGAERDLRIQVVSELATAEQLARRPSAMERFEELERLSDDPVTRANAILQQGLTVAYLDFRRAIELFERVGEELGDSEHPLALWAETMQAVFAAYDPKLADTFRERIPQFRERIAKRAPSSPSLALLLGAWMDQRDETPELARELIEWGWNGGAYLAAGEGVEVLPQALVTFIAGDEFERAAEMNAQISAAAAATGSFLIFLMAMAHNVFAATRQGDLEAAAEELRYVVERTQELGLVFGTMSVLAYGGDALLERPDLDDIAMLAEALEPGPWSEVGAGAMLIEIRGRLRFAAGRREQGIADVRHAGSVSDGIGFTNFHGSTGWRSTLALMLGPEDHEEADRKSVV